MARIRSWILTLDRRRARGSKCAVVLLLLVLSWASPAAEEEASVIVNGSVTKESLNRNTLRAIFGMRMRVWPDDQPIRVFVLPDDNPLHVRFCKTVLQVFAHQMRLAWDRGVFSGTGQAPILVGSERELVQRVASTPGAIGYAMGSSIDDQVAELDVQ